MKSPASDATDVRDGNLPQARGTAPLLRQLPLASAQGGGKQHRSRTREEADGVVRRQGLASGTHVARALASEETTASSEAGESGEEPAPVSPEVIADAVYRMICRDLTIERERRAG